MSRNPKGQRLSLDEAVVNGRHLEMMLHVELAYTDHDASTALSPGIQPQSAHSYGTSSFSTTAKITAIDASNKPTSFFLKVTGLSSLY